jgi:uncharacterized protein with PIN domain
MNLTNFLDRKYPAYGDCPVCGGKLIPSDDDIKTIKDKHLTQTGRKVKCKDCGQIFSWYDDPDIEI